MNCTYFGTICLIGNPPISDREQQHLIKAAMIDYFVANEYYAEVEK